MTEVVAASIDQWMVASHVCEHVQALRAFQASQAVHKEECTQCFVSDDATAAGGGASGGGVHVCLTCYNGSCETHAGRHREVTGHRVSLRIRKTEIIASGDEEAATAAPPPSSSATPAGARIVIDSSTDAASEPAYTYDVQVACHACHLRMPFAADATERAALLAAKTATALDTLVDRILSSNAATRPAVDSWSDAPMACEHTLTLEQHADAPKLSSKALAHCQQCELSQALWLCLTCGALGCSRKVFGGGGGNEHALQHWNETRHPLVLKMGTITPEGAGDVYCYQCDNTVVDANLSAHLAHFGIDIADQRQTEKTTLELSLDANLNHNWNLVLEEDGKSATLLFGQGFTGLQNLGNSCYMASVLQVLFALPAFRARYFDDAAARQHVSQCRNGRPADCFMCQLTKLAEGLLSGRYSPQPSAEALAEALADENRAAREKAALLEQHKRGDAAAPAAAAPRKRKAVLQPGVPPRTFKRLVTADHAEFRSTKQQDALEFFHFLLDLIKQKEHANGFNPYKPFQFQQEERIECLECHGVRYRSVTCSEVSMALPVGAPIVETNPTTGKTRKSYAPISLAACWQAWAAPSSIDDYRCTACRKSTRASSTTRFITFPEVMVVQLRRFVFDDWVPAKLDVEVLLGGDGGAVASSSSSSSAALPLDLDSLRSRGRLPNEVELPDQQQGASAASGSAPAVNEIVVEQLMTMGFSRNACVRAAVATKSDDAEVAAAWLFEHMGDADINDPLPAAAAAAAPATAGVAARVEPPADAIEQLEMMGFSRAQCVHALRQTACDVARAVEWLFSHADEPIPSEDQASVGASASGTPSANTNTACTDAGRASYHVIGGVTHLGKSTGSGHYVAHVVKPDGTVVLFNDQKVSRSDKPNPLGQAYMLFFTRT